jgi:SAM-dependent methyltransferase
LLFEGATDRYDVIEPFHDLWTDSPARAQVDHFYDDILDVPPDERYDKIISIAVLEHLTDLPHVIARCAEHLAPGGTFAAGYPSEGGLAWYLAWRFGTGTAYRLRTGLSYAPLMRHEHVNTAGEIGAVLKHLFRKVRLARFPIGATHLSFYTAAIAEEPILERCRAICVNRQTQSQSGVRSTDQ